MIRIFLVAEGEEGEARAVPGRVQVVRDFVVVDVQPAPHNVG